VSCRSVQPWQYSVCPTQFVDDIDVAVNPLNPIPVCLLKISVSWNTFVINLLHWRYGITRIFCLCLLDSICSLPTRIVGLTTPTLVVYGFHRCLFVCLFFLAISQKPMQIELPDLTHKCSTMRPENSFLLESKGQRSRSNVCVSYQTERNIAAAAA